MSRSALPSIPPHALRRREHAHGLAQRLARYTRPSSLVREIVALPGAQASRLLVDRLAGGLSDHRLLAHLSADEPAQNAKLICHMYLADPRRACRRLTAQELRTPPLPDPGMEPAGSASELRDQAGSLYRIRAVEGPLRRLRWTRSSPQRPGP